MTMVLNVVENPERNNDIMDLKSGLEVKEYKGVKQALERSDGRCLLRCTLLAATSAGMYSKNHEGLSSGLHGDLRTKTRAGASDNTMAQLDASVYTPLFIPTEEGVSVEQRKYQQQASLCYADAVNYVETFLTKVPTHVLDRARGNAAVASKSDSRKAARAAVFDHMCVYT
ncbi:hypothetical protein FGB62_65g19 [Gracilaria domingensis]|nr:hypothetical protein FGB62_65g19 [Gracilaria domingensis]